MTQPNDFATRLEGLIAEIAAETNSFKRFGLIQQQDALLANHAPAIARLVRAAEEVSRCYINDPVAGDDLKSALAALNAEDKT